MINLETARQDKRLRFLVSGGLAFMINIGIMAAFFQMPWTQESLWNKNISNLIITEISMLFAFMLHNHFTWKHSKAHSLCKRFIHFHLTSLFGLALRYSSFALLVYLDIHVYTATVITVLLAACVNYFFYDRLVFKEPTHDSC